MNIVNLVKVSMTIYKDLHQKVVNFWGNTSCSVLETLEPSRRQDQHIFIRFLKRFENQKNAYAKIQDLCHCLAQSKHIEAVYSDTPTNVHLRLSPQSLWDELQKNKTLSFAQNFPPPVQNFSVQETSRKDPVFSIYHALLRIDAVLRVAPACTDLKVPFSDNFQNRFEAVLVKKLAYAPILLDSTGVNVFRKLNFLFQMASDFHQYWDRPHNNRTTPQHMRFINPLNKSETTARILLLTCIQNTLKQGVNNFVPRLKEAF